MGDKGQAEATCVTKTLQFPLEGVQVADNSGMWVLLVFFLNVSSENHKCSFFQIQFSC